MYIYLPEKVLQGVDGVHDCFLAWEHVCEDVTTRRGHQLQPVVRIQVTGMPACLDRAPDPRRFAGKTAGTIVDQRGHFLDTLHRYIT